MKNIRLIIINMNVQAFPRRRQGREDELVPEMLEYLKPLKAKSRDFELLLLGLTVMNTWRHRSGQTRWEAYKKDVVVARRFLVNESGINIKEPLSS